MSGFLAGWAPPETNGSTKFNLVNFWSGQIGKSGHMLAKPLDHFEYTSWAEQNGRIKTGGHMGEIRLYRHGNYQKDSRFSFAIGFQWDAHLGSRFEALPVGQWSPNCTNQLYRPFVELRDHSQVSQMSVARLDFSMLAPIELSVKPIVGRSSGPDLVSDQLAANKVWCSATNGQWDRTVKFGQHCATGSASNQTPRSATSLAVQ